MRKLFIIFLFFFLFIVQGSLFSESREKVSKLEIRFLVKQLKTEGFSNKLLNEVFIKNKIERYSVQIKHNVLNRVKGNPYKKFLTRSSIKKAKRFYKKWLPTLKESQKKYYVDPKVIVGILLVETGLGTYTGKYNLVSLFSSLYLENQPIRLSKLKEQWRKEKTSRRDQKYYLKRLKRKSKWAYKQLLSILKMKKKGTDVNTIKGSYAGAFGLCQFIPASYLFYAVSYKKNHAPDLFDEKDAIFSVANYLRKNGWRKKMTTKRIKKSIWRYNHSKKYVNAIYKISTKI